MTEEEILKYAKIFSTAHGDTFKIHFDDKIINEPDVWKGVLDYIDKLQEENKNVDERNYSLGLGFIQIGEKLGLENFGIQTILLGIDKLQKENKKLKEENRKINKVADKMYEYISYYGWEDFESNTGCNREEMVDYFYKE